MSAWHTVVDSDTFRWLTDRGPARGVFRSRAFRRAMLERNRVIAGRARREEPTLFESVHTFCFFVGHNKSGTSLMGGMLDAHPQVVLADEGDALQYVRAGFGRDLLFHVLLRSSRTELRKGRVTARRLEPYSYLVPGQHQGTVTDPLVVGDSTSGTSTRRLAAEPELFDRLNELGTNVRLIQVVRNPFDPITALMLRSGRTRENSTAHYFTACDALQQIRARAGSDLLAVRYEDVVATPTATLERTCEFLGVPTDEEHLRACAAVIRDEPDRTRERIDWSPREIATIEALIPKYDFLDGYSYAN
jgi:hypothetical protein